MIKYNMVSELTSEEDIMQLWKLGLPIFGSLSTYFQQKKVELTLLSKACLSIEIESEVENFQFWTRY